MAFGINREELDTWKQNVASGQIAFLTHYWMDERFPGVTSVTKVGCADLDKLTAWCLEHKLDPRYIHKRNAYPHFDLMGSKQREVLLQEGMMHQIDRFRL
ncbi:hypothetical protein Q5741_04580 [Paenibacillus sp. JX-17]|uniref:DUF4031 domain-containing protein n=1 Tax=Paenibacillus lacisoli TaxID=3064525 RepID=A0ABT9C8V7_9BACL|nr:hypothetical protein [Paenibacillus sp. JX-17]MDO7905687.1 hypothetical protein [Paenibacillus sp. JX-17]